jgi:hypothetical protein
MHPSLPVGVRSGGPGGGLAPVCSGRLGAVGGVGVRVKVRVSVRVGRGHLSWRQTPNLAIGGCWASVGAPRERAAGSAGCFSKNDDNHS